MHKIRFKYYPLLILILISLCPFIANGQSDSLSESANDPPLVEVDLKHFKEGTIESYRSDEDFKYTSNANYDESLWSRIKRWFWSWYNRLLGNEASLFEKIVVWVIILASLLVVVYFLTKTSSSAIFSPNARRQKLHAEILDEKIDVSNIFKLIQAAEQNDDFRLAIRYRFVQALLDSEKGKYLVLEKYKTITDYVHEFESKGQGTAFEEISKIFEFVWYGDYQLSKNEYLSQSEVFDRFSESLNMK